MSLPTNFNVYKWTDTAAPQFTYIGSLGTSGGIAISSILDACLVNGYGDKAPLGWTKPYSSGNYHVYKMGANSSERYLQLYTANAATANDNSVAYLNVFESMTSATSGVGPITNCGNGQEFLRGSALQWGGYGGSAAATTDHKVPWALIGNSSGFYLWKSNYAPSSGNWGTGGIASYVGKYYNIASCMDIITYDNTVRTLLVCDGVNGSYDEAFFATQNYTTYLLSNNWSTYYGVYITGSTPFRSFPFSSTLTNYNTEAPRAILTSDNIFNYVDGKIFVGSNMTRNPRKSKVFVAASATDGSTPEIVGELPGVYRFAGDRSMESFMEGPDYITIFNNDFSTSLYGCFGLGIKRNGDWYGNPHFL